MAERLSLQFRRLLEERKLQKIQPKNDIINKEIASAEYDLRKSKNSCENEDYHIRARKLPNLFAEMNCA